MCCGIRYDDLRACHGKMVDLETAGHWKLVKERKIPYYDREDMPKKQKVLQH